MSHDFITRQRFLQLSYDEQQKYIADRIADVSEVVTSTLHWWCRVFKAVFLQEDENSDGGGDDVYTGDNDSEGEEVLFCTSLQEFPY